jgi:hypothetical protein
MKKLLHFVLLLGFCFIISGCPYETHVPIDAPSVKIDPGLLGFWVEQDNENVKYSVTGKDDFTYHIEVTQMEENDRESYLAYASQVNKIMFLNISRTEPSDNSPAFLLYKMEFKNDQWLTLSEVTDNIDETFSSSQELKKFISKNMSNSYFFGKEETNLVRPGK